MKPKIIYIAGFRQHAGKTTTSLGMIHSLSRIFDPDDIGYIKPVGQETVLQRHTVHHLHLGEVDHRILERGSHAKDVHGLVTALHRKGRKKHDGHSRHQNHPNVFHTHK